MTIVWISKIWKHGQLQPDLEYSMLVGTPDAAHFFFTAFMDGKIQILVHDNNKQKLTHITRVKILYKKILTKYFWYVFSNEYLHLSIKS